ncbi:hypothetical protein ENUP19_0146G0063 [Entamoeba nuttalli]|uniref:Sec23/Sec24 beta-sandwich domain containing protein n=2 Tax=Entamoeba nuttalli TaxID=412467 RepID=K2HC84_ENTNP|nr:Sec23/Sec24 beta-sandwich domain containing protein [Entamoeba nuttalli P19]EKE40324.1 Sec23/Sec24 beta-sandwich domain containing protein [Entamoeba nuttalli P19]|eukprot:XP_008857346.1 Sec23/Sec24 beta-sandwich domain containing protein [Entamoeba nuttalli P19]
MQQADDNFISTTFPLVPLTPQQIRETVLPLSLVVRPFLHEVQHIPMQLLRIPKCKICSAYFSPLTHWICPHSRYYCCVCHQIVADQPQRFIDCDRNKEIIPELNNNCVEYSGARIKEEINFTNVLIIDQCIVKDMQPFIQTIKNSFTILICSNTISTIVKGTSGYTEKIILNLSEDDIPQLCSIYSPTKAYKIGEWCKSYRGIVFKGNYLLEECLNVASKIIGKYGVIQCFHSLNYEYMKSKCNKNQMKDFGIDCMKKAIMINHYLIGTTNTIDCSLLRIQSKLTNGIFISNMLIDSCFIEKINRTIVGYDGNIRIRTPDNIDVIKAFGCVVGDNFGDCKVGVLTKDLTVIFKLRELEEMVKIKHQYQVIITFIGINGTKRIRVLNFGITVAPHISDAIKAVQPQMVILTMINSMANDYSNGMNKKDILKKYTDKLVTFLSYMGKNQPFSQFFHVLFKKFMEVEGVQEQQLIFSMEKVHRNVITTLVPKVVLVKPPNQFLIISNEILVVNCELMAFYAEELKKKFGVQAIEKSWQLKLNFIESVLHQADNYQTYFNYLMSLT